MSTLFPHTFSTGVQPIPTLFQHCVHHGSPHCFYSAHSFRMFFHVAFRYMSTCSQAVPIWISTCNMFLSMFLPSFFLLSAICATKNNSACSRIVPIFFVHDLFHTICRCSHMISNILPAACCAFGSTVFPT